MFHFLIILYITLGGEMEEEEEETTSEIIRKITMTDGGGNIDVLTVKTQHVF